MRNADSHSWKFGRCTKCDLRRTSGKESTARYFNEAGVELPRSGVQGRNVPPCVQTGAYIVAQAIDEFIGSIRARACRPLDIHW